MITREKSLCTHVELLCLLRLYSYLVFLDSTRSNYIYYHSVNSDSIQHLLHYVLVLVRVLKNKKMLPHSGREHNVHITVQTGVAFRVAAKNMLRNHCRFAMNRPNVP